MSLPSSSQILKTIRSDPERFGVDKSVNLDISLYEKDSNTASANGLPDTSSILKTIKSDPARFGVNSNDIDSLSALGSGFSTKKETPEEAKKGFFEGIGDYVKSFFGESAKTAGVSGNMLASQFKGTAAMLARTSADAYQMDSVTGVLMNLGPGGLSNFLLSKKEREKRGAEADKEAQKLSDSAQEDLKKVNEYIKANPLDVDVMSKPFAEKIKDPEWVARGLTLNAPSLLVSLGITTVVTLATKNPYAGYVAGFGTGFSMEAGDSYNTAIKEGVEEPEARKVGTIVGAINGVLEMIFPGKKMADLVGGKAIKKSLFKNLTKGVTEAVLGEAVPETIQEIVANAGQKTYNENIDLLQGAPEAGFFGLLMGGMVNATTGTVDTVANLKKGKESGDLDLSPTEALKKSKEPVVSTPNVEQGAKEFMTAQRTMADNAVNSLEEITTKTPVPEGKKRFYQIVGKTDTPWLWDDTDSLWEWAKSSLNEGEDVVAIDLNPTDAVLQDNGAYIAKEGVIQTAGKVASVKAQQNTVDQIEKNSGWTGGDAQKQKFDTALLTKDAKTVESMLAEVPQYYLDRFKTEIQEVVKTASAKPTNKEVVVKTSPELQKATEDSIKNAKTVKDVKSTLNSINKQLEEAVVEAEMMSVVNQEKRAGINTADVATLKRTYARSKALREGDIETARSYSEKMKSLINRIVENIQETRPDITSDDAALEYALNLPTKADETVKNPTASELSAKQKNLKKYLEQLKAKQKELKIKEDAELIAEFSRALTTSEKLSQSVKVPATQMPVGEGKEKISRLEARMRGILDTATLADKEALGLATYNEMNQDANIAAAAKFVLENPDDALKVITGEIAPPQGVLVNSVLIAMKEAGRTDTALALRIATYANTRAGQEIGILAKLDPNNPVTMMEEIVRTRLESFEKRTGKKVAEKVKQEVANIEKKVKAPTASQWDTFLASIRC